MEVVAAAPRCQLLLIMLMAAMLLPGMKGSLLLVWRKIAKTIKLQGSIGKEDENLWIASRLIWFDQSRPPDSSQTAPVKTGPSS
ncbi:hypothetical protein STEG23_011558 [Scotinomys teguina]